MTEHERLKYGIRGGVMLERLFPAARGSWKVAGMLAKGLAAAVREFKQDRCALRASALTYYSLLSIVPVMAMAFGIAKGFGFEKLLEKELMIRFSGQEEVAMKMIEFSMKILGETKGGVMAAIGVLFLLWAVVKTLSHIEDAFNAIWVIERGRVLIRKFTDYLALFFTAPMLLIFSGSVTVFIKTHLQQMVAVSGVPVLFGTMASGFVKLLPYGTLWLLFTFLYLFIPNKKVDLKASFAGGVIAGTVYQVAQVVYISSQVGVSHYNAIYGSFAALPLFLIWLQASWLILLFGAEIAYVMGDSDMLGQKGGDLSSMSMRLKKLLSLRIVLVCVRRFARGVDPASDIGISTELKIPLKVVRMLLAWLVECRILSEVNTPDGPRYQPARDIESLSIMTVVKALEEKGQDTIAVSGTLEYEALEEAFDTFASAARLSPGERLIKDI